MNNRKFFFCRLLSQCLSLFVRWIVEGALAHKHALKACLSKMFNVKINLCVEHTVALINMSSIYCSVSRGIRIRLWHQMWLKFVGKCIWYNFINNLCTLPNSLKKFNVFKMDFQWQCLFFYYYLYTISVIFSYLNVAKLDQI